MNATTRLGNLKHLGRIVEVCVPPGQWKRNAVIILADLEWEDVRSSDRFVPEFLDWCDELRGETE